MSLNSVNIFSLKYILIIFWMLSIISLNASHHYYYNFNLDFIGLVNVVRYLAPFAIVPIFCLLIALNYKNIKLNIFLILFILLGLFQFFSFFLNGHTLFDLMGCQILISYFAILLILISSNISKVEYKTFYIIFLVILSFVTTTFTFILLREAYLSGFTYMYWTYSLIPNEVTILDQQNPRITGLSRQLVLIYCFLFYYFLFILSKKKIISYILLFSLLFFLSLIIWGMQSRGSLVCWLVMWLVFFIFENKSFLKKTIILFILLIVPISIYEISAKQKIEEGGITSRILDKEHFQLERVITNKDTQEIEVVKQTDYSSGRIYIWKRSLKLFLDKPFFGYGPQGDRIALSGAKNIYKTEEASKELKKEISSKEKHIWNNNASNGLVYIALSAGILGLTTIVLLYLFIFKALIKSIFQLNSFKKENFFLKNCTTVIFILLARSIYENGFVLYSIDYIFFILSTLYLQKFIDESKV